jgi:hypothetical protein
MGRIFLFIFPIDGSAAGVSAWHKPSPLGGIIFTQTAPEQTSAPHTDI